ncbi:FtsW/RodA/SpoVE family cell cycle protein [Mobilitalea sibirica]|uniref:FtsW/RodA/SpoVE family cell cycle protein n=1 Tax=Mobilitalea sibirica TaxID=1462919 RepID=A0A8J7HAA0_9FIRM|nr:FtsW/RodA/SpoVE family cell cycle protein [Mobilitalea sibirica]MBH1939731.1 FtsW/RodA/SpoVE family cell cycle protein [Mobilitalea sibirica]
MHLVVELIQYLMVLLIGVYSFYSFSVVRFRNKRMQDKSYRKLSASIYLLHFIGYFTLYFQTMNDKLLFLYAGEVLLIILVNTFYQTFYPKRSKLLVSNMLMLLTIGFIILARLSYDKAVKQVLIVAVSFLVCLIVPVTIKRITFLKRFGWIYGILGIAILFVVLFAGTTNYGATNWLTIGGFSFQPSEIVKLIFVFSIAAMLQERINLKKICIVTVIAGVHVLILVIQKDLGGALIFFVTFVFMLYTATSRPLYLFSGLAGGSVAAFIAYKLFYHVRVRVMAWQNPMRYIEKEGYQISQSLFAIGTGGWFGMGLNRGLPTSIPVVESDFVFSAIAEEFGALFALCMILIYINCFIMLINIALTMEDAFYRLISLGFSVMFGFQVILSIGGVIKFIPSTGVTLPFISSGGSSVFATIVMFMILQGIYLKVKSDKEEPIEEGVQKDQ